MLLPKAMRCPRCQAHFESALEACGNCGFCLGEVESILGQDQVRLRRLTDRVHCLRLVDSRVLEQRLEIFSRRFPQVFVGVVFGELPSGVNLHELTFWLLNHARLIGEERVWDNDHAVILVIDPVAKIAGLNVGYALEFALPEKYLESLLRNIRTPLWHGEYVDAVTIVLQGLERRLRKIGQRMSIDNEFSPPENADQFVGGAEVRHGRDLDDERAFMERE